MKRLDEEDDPGFLSGFIAEEWCGKYKSLTNHLNGSFHNNESFLMV